MKSIDNYILEKFKINSETTKKNSCKPKDKNELKEIIKKRIIENQNADLNDIDVSDITDMSSLFGDIYYLCPSNIDISEWDVSKVKTMFNMFGQCSKFNCDLSKWDVSKVENMKMMFFLCENFKAEGLENWDVRNVTNMYLMFNGTNIKNKPSWYKK